MNIDKLVRKFDLEIEEINSKKEKLNSEKDAEYWLLLGKSESLSECIVEIIEEYLKSTSLSDYLSDQMIIHKI